MSAAALMGLVRMAVHSHATAGAPPDQVLTRTDRDLADLNASRFVSCLYAHHQVTLASAGHPPPLLRHADNRAHAVAVHPGPPLGVGLGSHSYPLTTLPLGPGALLALYTDGLVEIPDTDIAQTIADLADRLGESSGLPLHQLVDNLVHTLAKPVNTPTTSPYSCFSPTTLPGCDQTSMTGAQGTAWRVSGCSGRLWWPGPADRRAPQRQFCCVSPIE